MSFDELIRPAPRDLDWSDVEADAARMQWDEEQYPDFDEKQAEEEFRAGMTRWIEDHEVPADKQHEVDYLEYLEGFLPED